MTANQKRFALHLAFAAGAAAATFVVTNVSALSLPAGVDVVVIAVATSAASFFRSKSAE